MEYVSVRTKEAIAYVTLENTKQHNTLTFQLIEEIDELLQNIAKERKVKVVVIEGGKKAFSAGHSLQEIQTRSQEDVLKLFQRCYQFMRTIREIPQVVISKVEGVAVAAGCQLVAISDLAVASESARFATPGINSGLFCSTPAVFLSRNIGRKKAAELLFTGNLITAEEAFTYGLINEVVPSDQLDERTEQLAKDITKQSLEILEIGKRQFYQQLQMEDFQALNYASDVIAANSKHPDAEEGIQAFFEKRRPEWPSEKESVKKA